MDEIERVIKWFRPKKGAPTNSVAVNVNLDGQFNEDRRKAEILSKLAYKYGLDDLSDDDLLKHLDEIIGDTRRFIDDQIKRELSQLERVETETLLSEEFEAALDIAITALGDANSQEALHALSSLDAEATEFEARKASRPPPEPWPNFGLRADAMKLDSNWREAMQELEKALNLRPLGDVFDRIKLHRDQLRLSKTMGDSSAGLKIAKNLKHEVERALLSAPDDPHIFERGQRCGKRNW